MFGEAGLSAQEAELKLVDEAKIQARELENKLTKILSSNLVRLDQINYLQEQIDKQKLYIVELEDKCTELTKILRSVQSEIKNNTSTSLQASIIEIITSAVGDQEDA